MADRTRELCVLRAIGGFKSQIARLVVLEAMAISTIGMATGLAAGLMSAYCTISISVVVVAGFKLPFHFPWGLVSAAAPLIVLMSALSAWYPARRAASLQIAEGLLYE